MILRPLVIAGAWAVLLTTAGSVAWAADEKADAGGVIAVQAERGHDVARIWCAECHAIEPGGQAAVRTEAPAFEVVADREGQTHEAIGKFLLNPHPPMPDLALSRDQMRNLASYILSLKGDAAAQ